jgi:hypothetical protein
MGFEIFAPVKKASLVVCSLTKSQRFQARFFLSFPSVALKPPLLMAARVNVLVGDDDDYGFIRIVPAPDGAYKMVNLKHATILRVPALGVFAGHTAFALEPVKAIQYFEDYCLIALPDKLLASQAPATGVAVVGAISAAATMPKGLKFDGTIASCGGKAVQLSGRLKVLMDYFMEKQGGPVFESQAYVDTGILADEFSGVVELLRKKLSAIRILIVSSDGSSYKLRGGL